MNFKKIRIFGTQIDTAINIAPNSCCSAEHIVVVVGGPNRPGGPPGDVSGLPSPLNDGVGFFEHCLEVPLPPLGSLARIRGPSP